MTTPQEVKIGQVWVGLYARHRGRLAKVRSVRGETVMVTSQSERPSMLRVSTLLAHYRLVEDVK